MVYLYKENKLEVRVSGTDAEFGLIQSFFKTGVGVIIDVFSRRQKNV